MWNQGNHQFNMNQNNFMNNNQFHNNVNKGFQNNFNNMNNQTNNNMNFNNNMDFNNNINFNNNMNFMNNKMNQMNFSNNNMNFSNNHNNFSNNNPLCSNNMMNMMTQQQNRMMMQQNIQMQKIIQYNNQKLMMMKNMLYQQQMQQMKMNHWQNLQKKMNQILNEGENGLNGNNNNFDMQPQVIETEKERKEREEREKMSTALSEVAREQIAQQQNFAQLQLPQDINYDEVDPSFMETFISDKELFSGSGHNLTGKWAHNENRGGRPYNPPDGWIGFGLNVINKYDNGNNDWLACDGRPGEWCIAYHGACVRNTSDQIKQIIKPILQNNLKPGAGQACANNPDVNHPGQNIGIGVYCTPNITTAFGYAGIIEVNGYKYKVAFMLRVKPDKIRHSSGSDYWVLNAGDGNFSEMRPYRFLIRKVP